MENSMEEDLWENRIRRNSFLLLNIQCKRPEEVSRGQDHLAMTY
jgi:hypothetical protein